MLKATKVDGVYDSDPRTDSNAKLLRSVTYDQVLRDRLDVMDATSIVMCRENSLPMQVFNLNQSGALLEIMRGADIGTRVDNGEER